MTEGPTIAACTASRADEDGDRSALERAAQGDPAAFESIVQTHQEPLSRLAYRLLGWSPEADDVVQEVFLAALKNLGKFRGQCTLTTWLTSITINKCRSQMRKQWVRQAFLRKAGERPEEPPHAPAESGLMAREQFQQVRQAVQSLPASLREVVVLRYLQEMPVSQVGEVLGVSPGVVAGRLFRARAKLKDLLVGLAEDALE